MIDVEPQREVTTAGLPREKQALGKVASPSGDEATSSDFTFWVPEDALVEKTQIVHAVSRYGDTDVTFHAVVDEVFRRSRRRDVLEEADRYGGDVGAELALDSQGVTYAEATILNTDPSVLAPPREESTVFLSGPEEARSAYGVDDMAAPLPIGLLKNGGRAFAGPAFIDLDYLLGANGAHLNVNGIAGAATKSSFLLVVLYALLKNVRDYAAANPSAIDKRAIVPIILNVKGFDLMWLDRPSRPFERNRAQELAIWRDLGIADPEVFAEAQFLTPQQRGIRAGTAVGRDTARYSWSLGDVIANDLFPYLFGDEDREDENFLALMQDIDAFLTLENRSSDDTTRSLDPSGPQSFETLVDWVGDQAAMQEAARRLQNHHTGTWRKFYRRLRRVVVEGDGVLERTGFTGQPLNVVATETRAPFVVDLQSIRDRALQRFVVAAIFAQVSRARTGVTAVPDLAYVIVLDELNRWAPKGSHDPVTKLIERVVAEMRSLGVILFGAQQQASQVSPTVIENCSTRAIGRTGALELDQAIWGSLSSTLKRRIQNLQPNEKVVYQVAFKQPMHVRMPRPSWAMRRDESLSATATAGVFDERAAWER